MELYSKYPVICTLWAFMEIVCFGGVIFGWGSLVFILKEEGFYRDSCLADENTYKTHLLSSNTLINKTNDSNNTIFVNVTNLPTTVSHTMGGNSVYMTCANQESRLNLWFSIAVSFMYLTFTGIGYLIRNIGTRITRLLFLIVYLIGTLCLAFATPELPWLLLPGLCCMGTGGLVLLATNLQVANLHPHIRSTIVAIFTGLFDFSSITKQLINPLPHEKNLDWSKLKAFADDKIKVAHENGISRRTSYIFVACVYTVMILISTIFMLPYKTISEELVADIKRKRRGSTRNNSLKLETDDSLLRNQAEKSANQIEDVKEHPKSLRETLLSLTVVLHLYWLFVHALRFVTFIGLLNRWLEDVTNNDEQKVGELIGTFAYMTMGAIATALLCGFIYDWQRNKFADAGPVRQIYSPVVLPMSLVILYSISTTVLCYIKHMVAPYFAFVVFTFFRSSLFTVAVAFIGEAYPIDYFGVLFGFIQFAAGLAGLVQYPIFEWYDAYEGSYEHVNILLLALQVSTIVYPVLLYIRGRQDHGKKERTDITLVIPET